MLASVGISMDDQDRTTIDMRREQTLNRNARASGGVTQFASSASSVQKWAMKRSDAAETKKKLSVIWLVCRIPILFTRAYGQSKS